MPPISTLGRCYFAPLLLVLVGCADSSNPVANLPRVSVTGSVTLDGQPLAQGKIEFKPVNSAQGLTIAAIGEIKDGKYTIERSVGPVPGKYLISISSRPPVIISGNEPPGPLPKQDPEKVPAKFNSKSTLENEVKSDSINTLDFELKS